MCERYPQVYNVTEVDDAGPVSLCVTKPHLLIHSYKPRSLLPPRAPDSGGGRERGREAELAERIPWGGGNQRIGLDQETNS